VNKISDDAAKMEFRNVVFNAARDGKLRRLKVGLGCFIDQTAQN
jgi:hypothetical protein